MSAQAAIRRYDQFLMGNMKFSLKGPFDLDTSGMGKDSDEDDLIDPSCIEAKRKEAIEKTQKAKEEDALAVIRYVVRSILGWSPQEASEHITQEIIDKLKLEKVVSYVVYPADVSRKDDKEDGWPWLLHRAFPGDVRYDIREQVLSTYEKVKNGEIRQFPRYMFKGDNWDKKLSILLSEYIATHIPLGDMDELYSKFADSIEGNRILKNASLYYIYREFYESPLMYLHTSLGDSGDQFLFNYYLFKDALKESEREAAKEAEKEGEESL